MSEPVKGAKPGVVEKTFQALYGLPCWGVKHDDQRNLSLNFGKPALDVREPRPESETEGDIASIPRRLVTVRGSWWLWIYCSHWKLSLAGKSITRSSASARRVALGLALLDGQQLTQVDIDPHQGATRFEFDLGALLECRRMEPDSELWTLYTPKRRVLAVYGDGTFTDEHESTPMTTQRRRPLP